MKKGTYLILGCLLFIMSLINVFAAETILIKLNVEGNGQVIIAEEEEEIVFKDEYPKQSVGQNCEIGKNIKIAAKADDGYKFIKWTRNNEDFSIEQELTIPVEEDLELVAHFESLKSDNILAEEEQGNNIILYMIIGVGSLLGIVLLISLFIKKK